MAYFLALWLAESGLEGLVSGTRFSLRAEAERPGTGVGKKSPSVTTAGLGGRNSMSSHLSAPHDTAEARRIVAADSGQQDWRAWGPYLSELAWGTVREDYSDDGSAWDYFPHDQARSRAYRWGEDGIGGISDDHQYLCFSVALWNGKDRILKERLFG